MQGLLVSLHLFRIYHELYKSDSKQNCNKLMVVARVGVAVAVVLVHTIPAAVLTEFPVSTLQKASPFASITTFGQQVVNRDRAVLPPHRQRQRGNHLRLQVGSSRPPRQHGNCEASPARRRRLGRASSREGVQRVRGIVAPCVPNAHRTVDGSHGEEGAGVVEGDVRHGEAVARPSQGLHDGSFNAFNVVVAEIVPPHEVGARHRHEIRSVARTQCKCRDGLSVRHVVVVVLVAVAVVSVNF